MMNIKIGVLACVACGMLSVVAANAEVSQKGTETVKIPLEKAQAVLDGIVCSTAKDGKPLIMGKEPLVWRYEMLRRAYIEKKLGFSAQCKKNFPKLAEVSGGFTNKFAVAERFVEKVHRNLAVFKDGEIRWTLDGGKNGLSIMETSSRLEAAQYQCVKEVMKGREVANDAGTLWVVDDYFLFGYGKGLSEKEPEKTEFVFLLLRPIRNALPMTVIAMDFAPTRLIADSIRAAFNEDKNAIENFQTLMKAGIIRVVIPK